MTVSTNKDRRIDDVVVYGAPLAIDRSLNVVVLLLQHTGSIDTSLVRFEDRPVTIQLSFAGNKQG